MVGNINYLVYESLNDLYIDEGWGDIKTKVRNVVQHHANPMHIACRGMDCGLNPKTAKKIAGSYEKHVYNKIFPKSKTP